MRFLVGALTVAVLLGACSREVQLPQHEIHVPVPEQWEAAPTGGHATGEAWWAYFADPGLDKVISTTLDCNQSIQAAAERVEAADQERVVAAATAWPEVAIGGNQLRQRQNFVGLPFPGLADRVLTNTYTVAGAAFNFSWQPDLWKRAAAGEVGAEAALGVREAEWAAARLSLSGQAAKAWFGAVARRQQVALAESSLEKRVSDVALARERYRAGALSPVEVHSAEVLAENARAAVRQYEQLVVAPIRQIEILACAYPAGEYLVSETLPRLTESVPAGLPSELISRRPDLASAEHALLAADARIVQAQAALLPSFSLTAGLGTSSNTLLDLVNPSLAVWDLAQGVIIPLFNRGRLKANIRANEARAREAAANYEGMARAAFMEVETALALEVALREREGALQKSRQATVKALQAAGRRYAAGMAEVTTLQRLRQEDIQTQIAIVELHLAQLLNRVDLHLALGGGFASRPGYQNTADSIH